MKWAWNVFACCCEGKNAFLVEEIIVAPIADNS